MNKGGSKHNVNVYGYVRDVNGDYEIGGKIILAMAEKLDLVFNSIYTETSDGSVGNMPVAQGMINSLENCILIVPDTSDLYVDEELAVKLYREINNRNIVLIDCADLSFDNRMMEKKYSKMEPNIWFKHNLTVTVERSQRMKRDFEKEKMDEAILKTKSRIAKAFADC